MHKIIICNFVPIKECELDLAQFIVLTDAQAVGKSTVAKVVYYFSLVKELYRTLARCNFSNCSSISQKLAV